ncbi:MAG: FHA domain-containing protein [Actinomycetota bacterium]|nr:FHA domain-containing protein [Actinomycetota bacterium]
MKRCARCGNDNLDFAKFCDSCGAPLAEAVAPGDLSPLGVRGVHLRSEETGKEYSLEQDKEAIIGRGDPARGQRPDVTLEDEAALQRGVSRMHVKIIRGQGEYYIVDLNSTNSTCVNGTALIPQQAYVLSDGDVLELGNYRLTFHAT